MDRTFTHSKKQSKLTGKMLKDLEICNFSHPFVSLACRNLKIDSEQLNCKTVDEFYDTHVPYEVQMLRYNHHENRRKTRGELIAQYLVKKNLWVFRPWEATETRSVSTEKNRKMSVRCSLDFPLAVPLINTDLD